MIKLWIYDDMNSSGKVSYCDFSWTTSSSKTASECLYLTDCRKLNTLGKNKHSFSQISENNFPWLWFCRIYFVLVGILKGNCRGYNSTTPINFTTKCHWWVQSSFVLKGICDTGFSYSMKPLPTALMSWLLHWVFRRKGKKRGFQVWSWKHADLLQLATC